MWRRLSTRYDVKGYDLMPPKLAFLIFPSTVDSSFCNVLHGSPTLEKAARLVTQFQIYEKLRSLLTSTRGCGGSCDTTLLLREAHQVPFTHTHTQHARAVDMFHVYKIQEDTTF